MSCYGECTNKYKWWQPNMRKACMADCDAQIYAAQLTAQQSASESMGKAIKWVIPGMIILAILVIVAKQKGVI